MKLYIKYTGGVEWEPCANEELKKLGLSAAAIGPGMIELHDDVTPRQKKQVKEKLVDCGIQLVEGKDKVLVERMKHLIAQLVSGDRPEMKYSNCISEGLAYNYTYLSNVFSLSEGITIRQFIISRKIEKAKELMDSGELSITQIADKLNYSSVAHLSNQFKKVNGQSPTFYLREVDPLQNL